MAKRADHLIPADESAREEAEWLHRVAAGDEAAFARLYDRYARPLFSVAVHVLRDVAAAEDVLQEAFLQIWERAAQYDAACGKPLTWAVVLTRNKCIDRLRAQQRRQRLNDAARELDATAGMVMVPDRVSEQMALNEQVEIMRRALVALPPEQRHAIELAFLGGRTQAEIAAELAVPLGTVKARIRRGMLHLRARLEESALAEDRLPQNLPCL